MLNWIMSLEFWLYGVAGTATGGMEVKKNLKPET
jgi:hypothetical protein